MNATERAALPQGFVFARRDDGNNLNWLVHHGRDASNTRVGRLYTLVESSRTMAPFVLQKPGLRWQQRPAWTEGNGA